MSKNKKKISSRRLTDKSRKEQTRLILGEDPRPLNFSGIPTHSDVVLAVQYEIIQGNPFSNACISVAVSLVKEWPRFSSNVTQSESNVVRKVKSFMSLYVLEP